MEERKGSCVVCGKWFTTEKPERLYCGQPCQLRAYRQRVKKERVDLKAAIAAKPSTPVDGGKPINLKSISDATLKAEVDRRFGDSWRQEEIPVAVEAPEVSAKPKAKPAVRPEPAEEVLEGKTKKCRACAQDMPASSVASWCLKCQAAAKR